MVSEVFRRRGGMIPQPPGNMTQIFGKRHAVMGRQKPDERCGLRRKKLHCGFRAMCATCLPQMYVSEPRLSGSVLSRPLVPSLRGYVSGGSFPSLPFVRTLLWPFDVDLFNQIPRNRFFKNLISGFFGFPR